MDQGLEPLPMWRWLVLGAIMLAAGGGCYLATGDLPTALLLGVGGVWQGLSYRLRMNAAVRKRGGMLLWMFEHPMWVMTIAAIAFLLTLRSL
jgi:hypothetical protein